MRCIPLLAVESSAGAIWAFTIYTVLGLGLAVGAGQLLKSRNFLREYFLGSRDLGTWAFALTFAATAASGGTFIGFPALIYSHGWVMALWIASYMVYPLCTMGILGKRINQVARKTDAITVPDVLRDRFESVSFGLIATLLIVFFLTANMIAQFKGATLILEALLKDVPLMISAGGTVGEWTQGIEMFDSVKPSYLICLVIYTASMLFYTTVGGFRADVWTDVMQGMVMLVGVFIMLPLAIMAVGGLSEGTRKLAEIRPAVTVVAGDVDAPPGELSPSDAPPTVVAINDPQQTQTYVTGPGPSPKVDGFLPLGMAISFYFMWAISGTGQPQFMVRLMSFRDSATLRKAIITVTIYYAVIYIPLVIIFCCARVLMPGLEDNPDGIMPTMAIYLTDRAGIGWVAGILIAAPFAAVMSTVDSFLLVIASAIVRDIYQRNINPNVSERAVQRLSRITTFSIGLLIMILAINPPQFLQNLIVYVGSGLAACFLFPVVAALYVPRSNAPGCIAGMLVGFFAHLAPHVLGGGSFEHPIAILGCAPLIFGLLASFLAITIVTPLTAPPPEHLVRLYFYKPDPTPAPVSAAGDTTTPEQQG